jgi:hypothetical protein
VVVVKFTEKHDKNHETIVVVVVLVVVVVVVVAVIVIIIIILLLSPLSREIRSHRRAVTARNQHNPRQVFLNLLRRFPAIFRF